MSNIISTKEVCKILNVSGCTLAKWCRNGKVKFATTSGGHRRYDILEIEKLKPILSFGNRIFSNQQEPIKIIEVNNVDKQFCKCGCGREAPKATRNWHTKGVKKGQYLDYICGHHRRGKQQSKIEKMKRIKSKGGKPIFSPYLPNNESIRLRNGRWFCRKDCVPHAKAVYKYFNGEIPDDFVVHHKSGQCSRIEDDQIENLMLLPKKWNMWYFPLLSQGFGVPEARITNAYITCKENSKTDQELFKNICNTIIKEEN